MVLNLNDPLFAACAEQDAEGSREYLARATKSPQSTVGESLIGGAFDVVHCGQGI